MILTPGESNIFKIQDKKYVRTGVIADGSCFFHAISYSLSSKYRNMDLHQKRDYVKSLREKFVFKCSYNHWRKTSRGEMFRFLVIQELRNIYDKEWKEEIFAALANQWNSHNLSDCAHILFTYEVEDVQQLLNKISKKLYNDFLHHLGQNWVDDFTIDYLSTALETNFIFIDMETKKLCKMSKNEEYKNYVLIAWVDESHYESVAELNNENQAKRVFQKEDDVIQYYLQSN